MKHALARLKRRDPRSLFCDACQSVLQIYVDVGFLDQIAKHFFRHVRLVGPLVVFREIDLIVELHAGICVVLVDAFVNLDEQPAHQLANALITITQAQAAGHHPAHIIIRRHQGHRSPFARCGNCGADARRGGAVNQHVIFLRLRMK